MQSSKVLVLSVQWVVFNNQVLDQNGSAINGLYAVGNDAYVDWRHLWTKYAWY